MKNIILYASLIMLFNLFPAFSSSINGNPVELSFLAGQSAASDDSGLISISGFNPITDSGLVLTGLNPAEKEALKKAQKEKFIQFKKERPYFGAGLTLVITGFNFLVTSAVFGVMLNIQLNFLKEIVTTTNNDENSPQRFVDTSYSNFKTNYWGLVAFIITTISTGAAGVIMAAIGIPLMVIKKKSIVTMELQYRHGLSAALSIRI